MQDIPILSLQNAVVRYGKFEVLKQISVSVMAGTVGLLGPNGAGKSTFIKTLLGLLPISSGKIELMGIPQNIKNLPLIRQKIGYVPEGDCYLKGISSVQFIAFLAELTGIDTKLALKRSHEVLEYVGLGEERYRKLEELSFGQRSRVKLAQALVHNVDLLILDEPTDGMDPVGRENFFQILRHLQKNTSMSILLASHTLEDVESLCRQVILLYDGQILAVKNLSELQQENAKNFQVKFRQLSPDLNLLCEKNGWKLKLLDPETVLISGVTDPKAIFSIAHQTQTPIMSIAPWQPTLESLFLTIVEQQKKQQTSFI